MNRDMDLVRRIALATADSPSQSVAKLEGVDDGMFARHVQWMQEAGLLHAAILPKDSMQPATKAFVWRLTWQGCDFADSVRSDTLWKKAKEVVIKPSASWTFGVLTDWLKGQITEQIGNFTA